MARIAQVRELAESKGVEVLSRKWPSDKTILAFKGPCGHEFKQTYRGLRRNPTGKCQSCNQPKGERNGAWKNLSESQRQARLPEVKLRDFRPWARAVFARDQVCVITGSSEKLVAHHLNNWAEFEAQRWNVGNGVAITRDLHNEFHKRYGAATTRAMFAEFLAEKRAAQGL